MSRIVALGERARVHGFALAGATVVVAEDVADVIGAYEALEADVGLLLMTPAAAEVVASRLGERPRLLAVVMP
jgi:vacuolar-type H+-ATPase subunit F/Vma7